jgi:hypothetical protein
MRRRQLRIRRWLALAAALVTLSFASSASAIPVAGIAGNAGGNTVVDPHYGLGLSSATGATLVGRPPDVQDAATAAQTLPDVLERYAAAHPYGAGLTSATSSSEVARPPDVRDAAYVARTIVPSQSSGFDWNDYAIGIGSGVGFTLLLAGCLAATPLLRRRQEVRTAEAPTRVATS